MELWIYQVYFMAICLMGTVSGNVGDDFFSTPKWCSENSDCSGIHPSAVCATYEILPTNITELPIDQDEELMPVTVTNIANDTTNDTANDTESSGDDVIILTTSSPSVEMKRCRCNSDLGFHKEQEICVKHIAVGHLCLTDGSTVCSDKHATCVSDGTNSDHRRCLCQDGYVSVYKDGKQICARALSVAMDATCYTCDHNEGMCYDIDDDGSHDGCLCPTTRSGDNCTTEHVSVHCNVDKFKMIICYNAHANIDFSRGIWLHVTGRDDDSMCRGHDIKSDDTECLDWDSKLELDLHTPKRWRCGTEEITRIPTVRRFVNSITAAAIGPVIDSSNSITFKAYCDFATSAETSFNGVNVNAVPGNDRGETKTPGLIMQVLYGLDIPVPEGVALRLGDIVHFQINLIDDGVYSALRVEQCTASSSPVIPDPKAVVLPLIVNGCPASNQFVMTSKNNWHLASEAKNIVRTGRVKVFKMSIGSSVFLHCGVKLCLRGAEEDCDPVMCTKSGAHLSHGRKRRAADTTTSITRELRWYEEELPSDTQRQIAADSAQSHSKSVIVMESAGFGVLLTLLLVLLCVFMLISALLFYRLRRGNFHNPPDDTHPKPQQFALPRLNRNTFRI